MEGEKKCFGLLLALFIMVGLSLSVFSTDTNAAQHNLVTFPLAGVSLPDNSNCFSLDSSTNRYYFNPSSNCSYTTSSSSFSLRFQGDSYDSTFYNDLAPRSSLSYIYGDLNNDNSCSLRQIWQGAGGRGLINPILVFEPGTYNSVSSGAWTSNDRFIFDYPFNTRSSCQKRSEFGFSLQGNTPSLDGLGVFLTCNRSNGAVCDGLWDARHYVNNEIFPYWYGQDSVYLQDHYDGSNGLSYSHEFSLDDLFNKSIKKFSYMSIPINDFDEWYFYDSSNLTSGRYFNVNGTFDFEGSFSWHPDIQTNGSYFRVYYRGWSATYNRLTEERYVNCDVNLITLGATGTTHLDYSCPFSLDQDYVWLDVRFAISGNGNYIWDTDGKWTFYTTFFTTDNDSTPGRPFGTSVTGGASKKIGSAEIDYLNSSNGIIIDANNIDNIFSNFTDYLSNLFAFNLFNPFGFIFNLFSDSNSCAQIPTLSGMLHSEETEVCPYFDSTVRNILTPVISIVSTMLIFGFILRWIRSSSSDFSPEVIGGK